MLGKHVGCLHADATAAGCCTHRLDQRQASVRSGWRYLDLPILTVRPEAGVGPQLASYANLSYRSAAA